MTIRRKVQLRFRCLRRGHRWNVHYGDQDHEHCERCGKARELPRD